MLSAIPTPFRFRDLPGQSNSEEREQLALRVTQRQPENRNSSCAIKIAVELAEEIRTKHGDLLAVKGQPTTISLRALLRNCSKKGILEFSEFKVYVGESNIESDMEDEQVTKDVQESQDEQQSNDAESVSGEAPEEQSQAKELVNNETTV